MKKYFILLVLTCTTLFVQASEGHYWLNVEKQHIQASDVSTHFAHWFSLDETMTFEIFNDQTDDLGMRHIAYQQYWDGILCENQMIIVHAKDNKVVSVNAAIMEVERQPQLLRRSINKKTASKMIPHAAFVSDMMVVKCTINGESTFRWAYKVADMQNKEDVYIDAETGNIIKRISHIRKADVTTQGNTMYYGWKDIIVTQKDGQYVLEDNTRNIRTINAQNANSTGMANFWNEWGGKNISTQMATAGKAAWSELVNSCTDVTYASIPCNNNPILYAITVYDTPDATWYTNSADGKLGLYAAVFDAEGNLLYDPPTYKPDASLYCIYNFPDEVVLDETKSYQIGIFDYDSSTGNSNLGAAIPIQGSDKGVIFYSDNKARGWYAIRRNPEVDAHWGMIETYDFYKEVFNRNSFDNKGSEILQLLNPPADEFFSTMPNNAYASAWNYQGTVIEDMFPSYMVYGYGDGLMMTPVVALDVMAHEFTHMVTDFNGHGGLEYAGESGALNESFSDIMGFSVEQYVLGDDDYLIGEEVEVHSEFMRSMKDPKASNQPDTYKGTNWVNTANTSEDNDNGGVHTNSGIQNKWFYLLCEGGSGTNDKGHAYSVKGISIEKARQIAYRNLQNYLTPQANHTDARNGSLQAAADLYGANSQEYISTANAWYAVGVGTSMEDLPGENPNPNLSELTEGKYVIVAQRTAERNFFYMTADLGTATTKRYQAVDTRALYLNHITTSNLDNEYIWEVECVGEKIKLKNGNQYSTWVNGNSANFDATGKELSVTKNENGSFTLTYNARYLSLNANASYNFFAYYGNNQQITELFFLPYTESSTSAIEQTASNQARVFAAHNTIIIQSDEPQPVLIYDVLGQCIFNQVTSTTNIAVEKSGVYLVKMNNNITKVLVP